MFKILRNVAPKLLINKIYVALAQSILVYCIPIWGGAAKTKFIELERAQRALIKVMHFKPFRFPTDLLHSSSQLLSVRKLYIIHAVLKMHKTLPLDRNTQERRRYDKVAKIQATKTTFASNQYVRKSAHLYNLICKFLNIHPKPYYDCKQTLTDWILTKTYDETEALLQYVS